MENEERPFRRPTLAGIVPSGLLSSLVINGACPYMAYQLLSQHMPVLGALVLAALFPIFGLVTSMVQQRSADLVALGALIGILIVALLITVTPAFDENTQQPHLLKAGLIGLFGCIVLLSQLLPRPILFYVDRFFTSDNQAQKIAVYNAFWQHSAGYRSVLKRLNMAWGIGQIAISLVVIILLFVLSLSLFLFISPIVECGGYIALLIGTVQYKSNYMDRLKRDEKEF